MQIDFGKEYLNYFGGSYGLPTFHYRHGKTVSVDQLERAIESMVDRADHIFTTTDLPKEEYNEWNRLLNLWAKDMESIAV